MKKVQRFLFRHFLFVVSVMFFLSMNGGILPGKCYAQSGVWTWMHGDTISYFQGSFGTQGVFDPANKPPASSSASSWTDLEGNFWFFGGNNSNLFTNQYQSVLWKFNPLINQWARIKGNIQPNNFGTYGTKGVADENNQPGGRSEAVTWIDIAGNLWLYGGVGYSASTYSYTLNDLWKYDIVTNEWTWMSGNNDGTSPSEYGIRGVSDPTNLPPSKRNAYTWTSTDGDLWMFGGLGADGNNDVGDQNDMWKYDVDNNLWTWMGGKKHFNKPGHFGTLQVPDSSNLPPSRSVGVSWVDGQGNFWLHGGVNFSFQLTYGDTWRYDPSTTLWTWMNGPSESYQPYKAHGYCIQNDETYPGTRVFSVSFGTNLAGNSWLYGGYNTNAMGDVWYFNDNTFEWAVANGLSVIGSVNSHYGSLLVPDALNHPSGRRGATGWMDHLGNLWLFGGSDIVTMYNAFGDLWRYSPDPDCGGYLTGLAENPDAPPQFNVFPNPSNGIFSIQFSNDQIAKARIEIRNAIGQIVFVSEESNSNQHFDKTIDLSEMSSGFYLLQLTVENKSFSKKLMITRSE